MRHRRLAIVGATCLFVLGLLMFLLRSGLFGRDPAQSLKAAAVEYRDAVLTGDYDRLAKLNYYSQSLFKEIDRTVLAQQLKTNAEELKDEGFVDQDIILSDPLFIREKVGFLFGAVPATYHTTVPGGGKQEIATLLLGISRDKGATWEFLSGRYFGNSRGVMESMVPELGKDFFPLPDLRYSVRYEPGARKVADKSLGLTWLSSLDEALKEGSKLERPVLLVFTTVSSPEAREDEIVLETLRPTLKRFVRVKLYTDVVLEDVPDRLEKARLNSELQKTAFRTETTPLYLILRPTPPGGYEILAKQEGGFAGDRLAMVRFLTHLLKGP